MSRNIYDTSIKHLVRLNLTDIIPADLFKTIPIANIYRWKNEPSQKYTGCELNKIANQQYQLLLNVAQSQKSQKILNAYFQLIQVYKNVFNKVKEVKKYFFQCKENLVDTIQKVKPVLGLQKAIQFLGITQSTFYNWLLETKVKCEFNYFQICNRLRPNQLSKQEVLNLKELLQNPIFYYWPLSSICYYAQRNHILHIHLSTFYKYAKLLGVFRPKYSKPKVKLGIRVSKVNELWHADVTRFNLNNQIYYLYFVIDNYTHFVVSWAMCTSLSGKNMRDVLIKGMDNYKPKNANLLVDGGSENNNTIIDDLLTKNKNMLKKIVAQKDITFSNSMVEALNKIIKNNYLKMMNIDTEKSLLESIDFAVHDYNFNRPHHALKGSTPAEVFYNKPWDRNTQIEQFNKAKALRIAQNTQNRCKGC